MKNICIITGTRAEYGLLKGLIKDLNESPDFNLLLFVTGSHLEKKYGLTYKNIENDGFTITEKIYMQLNDDSSKGIIKSMAKELDGLADSFNKYKIDILLILGDRYEMLIAAQAALINNIPIGHLCGGDVTEGAYDDAIRNSITKMAKYHFVTCQSSYDNIIKMNENKNNTYLVGNPGLYDILNFTPLDKNLFYKKLNIIKNKYLILVVYHSETLLSETNNKNNFDILIDSISSIENFKDINFIFIHSNADSFNNYIFKIINNITLKYNNIYSFRSLERYLYLNIINYCDLFIGNSSSGIYEVPLFKKATLNLGNRQKGRNHGSSVINLNFEKYHILKNINNIFNNNNLINEITYPYKILNSSKIILDILNKNL
jgi:UDP-hydrolysing UDP-N-acetyl-D-glucosamine 2-epimerase